MYSMSMNMWKLIWDVKMDPMNFCGYKNTLEMNEKQISIPTYWNFSFLAENIKLFPKRFCFEGKYSYYKKEIEFGKSRSKRCVRNHALERLKLIDLQTVLRYHR